MQEHLYISDSADLARLQTLGFSEAEAARLVYLKTHVTDQVEYREMVAESRRLSFIRWLIEHDRLSR